MNFGARVQDRQNRLQEEISHFLTLPTQGNSYTKTKPQCFIKSKDICYNKGLISQIINTRKKMIKSFSIIGSTSLSFKTVKV